MPEHQIETRRRLPKPALGRGEQRSVTSGSRAAGARRQLAACPPWTIVAGLGVASGVLAGNVGLAPSVLPALGAAAIVAAVGYFPGRVHLAAQPTPGRARSALRRALVYLDDGVRWSVDLLRSRDPLLIFGSLGYLAFDVAAMATAFRTFGWAPARRGTLVLADTLGQAGAIIPIPGSSEAGLIGVFVLYGAPLALATSVVLLYRVFQAGIPVIVGLIGMADVRHLLHDAPPPEEVARRFENNQESSQP